MKIATVRKSEKPTEDWYFTMSSNAYGAEEFGAYATEAKALAAIRRVRRDAHKLKDGVERDFTPPYRRKG